MQRYFHRKEGLKHATSHGKQNPMYRRDGFHHCGTDGPFPIVRPFGFCPIGNPDLQRSGKATSAMKASSIRIHLDNGEYVTLDFNSRTIEFSGSTAEQMLKVVPFELLRKLKVIEEAFSDDVPDESRG